MNTVMESADLVSMNIVLVFNKGHPLNLTCGTSNLSCVSIFIAGHIHTYTHKHNSRIYNTTLIADHVHIYCAAMCAKKRHIRSKDH